MKKSAELVVKRMELSKLKPHPKNPRKHPAPGSPEWVALRTSLESSYFDPIGSGTTLIACEQLSRKCRAMEINPGYVAVALQRWADATGKKPTLAKD